MQRFNRGDLVKHQWFSDLGVVEHYEEKTNFYRVKFPNDNKNTGVPDSLLRKPTFQEFSWYRDPITRKMKIGNNRAIAVIISLIGGAFSVASSFTIDGSWKFAPMVIGAMVISANYIGLRYNYTRRWV